MTALLLLALLTAPQADTAKKLAFTGDAGLVSTSGNTTLTTVNVGDKIELRSGAWKVAQTFNVVYGRNDSVTTSSLWEASLRGERALGARVGLFVLGAWDRNTFAGVRGRTSPQLGLSMQLLATDRDKLALEVGGGYTMLRAVDAEDDRDFASGRAALRYDRRFGEKTTLAQAVEYLPDFEIGNARRVNYRIALTAPIASGLSLKTGYDIRYDGRPAAGFKRTDRILTTGIQVTF